MELKRIIIQLSATPRLADVFLYDHVRVHPLIKNLWLKQVSVWKYSILLNRLTASQIAAWQNHSANNTWENIDPYSSLEDIGSLSSENEHQPDLEPAVTPKLNCEGSIKDRLRKRHPSRPNTGRPISQASKDKTYQDVTLWDDPTPKKAVCRLNRLLEPSKDRIAARGKILIPPTKITC